MQVLTTQHISERYIEELLLTYLLIYLLIFNSRNQEHYAMTASLCFTLLLLCGTQGFSTCLEIMTVVVGDPLRLNCSYECSSGFVRGCWRKERGTRQPCLPTIHQPRVINQSSCTVSYYVSRVSMQDLKDNYTCYTVKTDEPELPQHIQRVVYLQPKASPSPIKPVPDRTAVPKTVSSPGDHNPNWTFPPTGAAPAEPSGEFSGIKVLAAVTISAAMVLAALAVYLCMSRNRQRRNTKGEPVLSLSDSSMDSRPVLSPTKGPTSAKCEKVTLRIPTPDSQSDTEVPYADIMIAVRGASSPELTQVCYLTTGDPTEMWREQASCLSPIPRTSGGGQCPLQTCRSADRLHVHPRETDRLHVHPRETDRLHVHPRETVTRKMSTNSEYAVITYS